MEISANGLRATWRKVIVSRASGGSSQQMKRANEDEEVDGGHIHANRVQQVQCRLKRQRATSGVARVPDTVTVWLVWPARLLLHA